MSRFATHFHRLNDIHIPMTFMFLADNDEEGSEDSLLHTNECYNTPSEETPISRLPHELHKFLAPQLK